MLAKPQFIGNTKSPLSEAERIERKRIRARTAQRQPRIAGQCCAQCGSTANVERHHGDYNTPDAIAWLCKACHHSAHYRHAGVRDLAGIRKLINALRK